MIAVPRPTGDDRRLGREKGEPVGVRRPRRAVMRDLQNVRLIRTHAVYAAVQNVLCELQLGQNALLSCGVRVGGQQNIDARIAHVEHGRGGVGVRLVHAVRRNTDNVCARSVPDDVIAGERLRLTALACDRCEQSLIGGRRRGEHGQIEFVRLKDAQKFGKPAVMIDVGVRCKQRERAHVQSLYVGNDRVICLKRAVARVHDEHIPARELHDRAVPLPDGEKMQAHLPFPARGDLRCGQKGAVRDNGEQQRHGKRDEAHERRAQQAQDAPPPSRLVPRAHPARRRDFFFCASAIAARISSMRDFASL